MSQFSGIAKKLRAAYAFKRRVDMTSFGLLLACCVLFSFFLYFLLDYLTRFPSVLRMILTLGIFAFFLIYIPWRHRKFFRKKDSLSAIAGEIEEKALQQKKGGFQAVLVSATEFSEGREHGSAELREIVIKSAQDDSYDPSTVTLFSKKLGKYALYGLGTVLVLYLIWSLLTPEHMGIFFMRTSGIDCSYPQRTRILEIQAFDQITRYRDYPLQITAEGVLPPEGRVILTYEGERAYEMPLDATDVPGVYKANVTKVAKNFSFSVALGDAQSDSFNVKVIRHPEIISGEIVLTPPVYTGLKTHSVQFGSFESTEGSRFTFRFKSDKELLKAELVKSSGEVIPGKLENGVCSFENMSLDKSFSFTIRLIDSEGFENLDKIEFFAVSTPDKLPLVTMNQPESGLTLSPQSILRYSIKASDDFGMKTLYFQYTVYRKEQKGDAIENVMVHTKLLKLRDLNSEKEVLASGTIPANLLEIEPGQTAELIAVVEDGKGSRNGDEKYGESHAISLTMLTPAELRKVIDDESIGASRILQDVQADMQRQKKTIELILKRKMEK